MEKTDFSKILGTTHEAGLLRLPNETLLHVFANLPTEDLLIPAMVSRRLHYLLLPIYFSHHGLPEQPTKLDDNTISALPGLRISLFTPSLHSISLKLEYDRTESIFQLVRELKGLLLSLEGVDAVSFNLFSSHTWIETARWRESFGALLKTTTQRCRNLTVDGLMILRDPTQSAPSNHLLKRGLDALLSHSKHPQAEISKLEFFVIGAPMLVRPPFVDWTLRTINSSHLTSLCLELSKIKISQDEWTPVLRALDVPGLQTFSFASLEVYLPDLWNFTARHPSITKFTLRIPSNYIKPARIETIPKTSLPNLGTLVINTHLALNCLSHPTSLLRLQRVAFITPSADNEEDAGFKKNNFDQALGSIAGRSMITALELEFHGAEAYKIIEIHSDPSTIIGAHKDAPSRVLRFINHLELRWTTIHKSPQFIALLPKWLKTSFPALCVLSIESSVIDSDEKGSETLETIRGLVPEVEIVS